jgi:hypothetical protein
MIAADSRSGRRVLIRESPFLPPGSWSARYGTASGRIPPGELSALATARDPPHITQARKPTTDYTDHTDKKYKDNEEGRKAGEGQAAGSGFLFLPSCFPYSSLFSSVLSV